MARKSAQEEFFYSFLPQLENAYHDDVSEDPTIDLGNIVSRSSVNNNSKQQEVVSCCKPDSTLEELEIIVGELKKKSKYSVKLINIMKKGLKDSLDDDTFKLFSRGLPRSCYPLVKMNDDNAPYVEFIIKSELADQAIDSQIRDYSMKHIMYSQYIWDNLYENIRKVDNTQTASNSLLRNHSAPIRSPRANPPQKRLHDARKDNPIQSAPNSLIGKCSTPVNSPKRNQQQKRLHDCAKKNDSAQTAPNSIIGTCSTPINSQKRSQLHKRPATVDDSDNSKRILPYRACKVYSSHK